MLMQKKENTIISISPSLILDPPSDRSVSMVNWNCFASSYEFIRKFKLDKDSIIVIITWVIEFNLMDVVLLHTHKDSILCRAGGWMGQLDLGGGQKL